MLIEIASDRFRTKQIRFHSGLNVVLGDENATNSIGKSTLLMIIDFGLGGESLLEHNIDLVVELGEHDYFFTFSFDGEEHVFRRGTSEPTVVYRCDENHAPVAVLSLAEYTAFLKQSYAISLADISFRAVAGLYFRVWGKENLNVRRPLHAAAAQPARECVTNLIKTFGRYDEIRSLSEELATNENKQSALTSAAKHRIVPKIGKRDYAANTTRIAKLEEELDDIKTNLARYATNLSEIVNREVLELKFGKDDLLQLRMSLQNRLTRTRRNIGENRHIKSRHFAGLKEYFPQINEAKLATVEEFHSGLAAALRSELRASELELVAQIARVDQEIASIDSKLTQTLASIDQPTVIVDRVVSLATSITTAREENQKFDNERDLKATIATLKAALSEVKRNVLSLVESVVNDGIRRIVLLVFDEGRKSPKLALTETNYEYEVYEDTGTGTAYASMIVLDLAMFASSQLPVIAHDSLLYKNIENDSAARLFRIYASHKKQSFLAIDEIEKYGEDTSAFLRAASVIQLDSANVLYTKNWKSKV